MTDRTAPNLKRFIRDLLIVLGVTLAMLAAVVSAAHGDSIRLLDQAASNQPKVLLREVAELDGPAAEKLGDTVVAEIREGGANTKLSLETLRQILTEHGVNWGSMSLRGYGLCRVELRRRESPPPVADSSAAVAANPKVEVGLGSALSVRDSLVGLIATLSGVDRADLRIRFAAADERVLSMSTLADRFEFEPQSSTGLGTVPFVIRRWSGERLVETIRVCAEVQRRCLALVTTRGVSRGQTFSPSDVEVREVYLDTVPASPMADPARVVGQDAMVTLRKGSVVFADNLRSPIIVKRGEVISVRCISGGVVVKTIGRAAEDGSINQVIKAHNERTQGTFLVRVIGPLEAVLENSDAPGTPGTPGTTPGTAPVKKHQRGGEQG